MLFPKPRVSTGKHLLWTVVAICLGQRGCGHSRSGVVARATVHSLQSTDTHLAHTQNCDRCDRNTGRHVSSPGRWEMIVCIRTTSHSLTTDACQSG